MWAARLTGLATHLRCSVLERVPACAVAGLADAAAVASAAVVATTHLDVISLTATTAAA